MSSELIPHDPAFCYFRVALPQKGLLLQKPVVCPKSRNKIFVLKG